LTAASIPEHYFDGSIFDCRYYLRELTAEELITYISAVKIADLSDAKSTITLSANWNGQPLLSSSQLARMLSGDFSSVFVASKSSLSQQSWNFAVNRQLIDLFSALAEKDMKKQPNRAHDEEDDEDPDRETSSALQEVNPNRLVKMLNNKVLDSYPLLSTMPPQDMALRFSFIQLLNRKLESVLPFIDFSKASNAWSLASRLASLSSIVFLEIKSRVWRAILAQTNAGGRQYVTVNRPRAFGAKQKGTDPEGRKSVFGQIYRQLHFLRPSSLRASGRQYSVNFEGEGSTDAGGPFRESLTNMCSELQSDTLPLFIRCPNGTGNVGLNQEKYIPNPNAKALLHLSYYAFVGKLFGMAVRGGHILALVLCFFVSSCVFSS
jgi:hypothetical protein